MTMSWGDEQDKLRAEAMGFHEPSAADITPEAIQPLPTTQPVVVTTGFEHMQQEDSREEYTRG